jgi:PAS domain S-box-containing protein
MTLVDNTYLLGINAVFPRKTMGDQLFTEQGSSIFVVLRDPELMKSLTRSLVDLGYRIAGTAISGEETLRRVAEIQPDLVLMDIDLEGPVDGIDAADRIRTRYSMPVVYVGDWGGEVPWERAIQTLPCGYVRNTAGSAELRLSIETALHKHKADRQVHQNEERLNMAVTAGRLGLWDWDLTTGEVAFDERSAEILGYSLEEIRPLTSEWTGFIHPDDQSWVMDAVKAHLEGRTPYYETVHRRRHKSGAWVWIMARGQVVERDANSRPLRVTGTHLDVTAQKEVEEALRKSEQVHAIRSKISHIFLTAPADEMYGEVLQVILQATASAYGVFGYIDEQGALVCPSMTRSIWQHCQMESKDIIFPREKWGGIWARTLTEKRTLWSNQPFRVPEGHIPVTRAVDVPLVYRGESIGHLLVANKSTDYDQEDVSLLETIADHVAPILHARLEREREEKRRQEAEAGLELKALVLDQIQDHVVITDLSGIITYVNHAQIHTLGRPESEFLGSSTAIFGEDPKRSVSQQEIVDKTLRYGKWRGEVINYARDGRELVMDSRTMVVQDPEGKPICLCGISTDVTERKRAQAVLLQSEKYKAVADLTRGVAHNFNNLLQIVLGNADLAVLDLESGSFTDLKEKLKEISASARFGAETVRRLNRFARDAEEHETREAEVFDLSEMVRQAAEMTKPWWKSEPEKRGLAVSLECVIQSSCFVRGNKPEMFEVVVNLIRNAAEALPHGGSIELETARDEQEVILYVRDTGIGIPQEHWSRIFTPFFTSHSEAGRGLGLATCRSIVQSHQGEIGVTSVKGRGTTFTVRLPLTTQRQEMDEPVGPASPTQPLNILVIDDMEGTVRLLKRGLEKMGHSVVTALSGRQGLTCLDTGRMDVVICDLGMPDMNGWQVGQALKSRFQANSQPKPKFIILTGWVDQTAERDKIAEAGVDAVVEKPVDVPRLMGVVMDVMQQESE